MVNQHQSSAQATILAQQWRSRSESDEGSPSLGYSHSGLVRSLAYEWTSGSEEDDLSPNMLTHERMLDSDANDVGLAPALISSKSADSEDSHGSQLMVSPSRITITPSATTFLNFHSQYPSSQNSSLASPYLAAKHALSTHVDRVGGRYEAGVPITGQRCKLRPCS